MVESHYSFLDRLLHRLVLEYGAIAQMSFDIDQMLVKGDPDQILAQRHIFVSGLARAGTTVLMRRFHATGLYTSLTYNDMPFVLAPNLWRRFTSLSQRKSEYSERAHGDNVLVNTDSPESLDEVFWRIYSKGEYLKKSHLVPHEPEPELIQDFIRYVNAILFSDFQSKKRYLSKNNNNILRLNAIHQAFPNALIVIPFRDPLQHAYSLLRQHRHFSKIQNDCMFTRKYMGWLGHHEFGLDHRPFKFTDSTLSEYSDDTIDYWLLVWCQVYEWLEKTKPQSALFISYEELCTRQETWETLATLAEIPHDQDSGEPFNLSSHEIEELPDPNLRDKACKIYERLTVTSTQSINTYSAKQTVKSAGL